MTHQYKTGDRVITKEFHSEDREVGTVAYTSIHGLVNVRFEDGRNGWYNPKAVEPFSGK